jgi:hypothetical protein
MRDLVDIVIFRDFVTRWVRHATNCTRRCGGLSAVYFELGAVASAGVNLAYHS